MASQWFYRLDGKEHGPVSSNAIRELAISGRLRPTDEIRKDGNEEWKPAGESAKLFPGGISDLRSTVTGLAADITSADAKAVLTAAATTTGKAAKQTGLDLRQFAATATKAATLAAEKMEITTLSLDEAFTKLGKHCYEVGTAREQFSDLFKKIDVLFESPDKQSPPDNQDDTPNSAQPTPKRTTKTDEPTWQQGLAFEELGKAFYEQTPAPTDPAELLTPIRSLYSRLTEIDASLVTHKAALTGNGKGIPPIVVGLAIVFLMPVGLYLLWTHPTLGSNRRWWTAACSLLLLILAMGLFSKNPYGSNSPRRSAESQSSSSASSKVDKNSYQSGFNRGVEIANAMVTHAKLLRGTGDPPTKLEHLDGLRKQAVKMDRQAEDMGESELWRGMSDGFNSVAVPYIRSEGG
jgi:hypothetical protein